MSREIAELERRRLVGFDETLDPESDAESSETPDAGALQMADAGALQMADFMLHQLRAPAVEPAADSDDESIETPDSLPSLVSEADRRPLESDSDSDEFPLRPDPLVWACCGEVHPVLMRINTLTPPLIIRHEINDLHW